MKKIVIIGTLDTKGAELGFLRDLIVQRGHRPIVVDVGIRGAAQIAADLSRDEVAAAAGQTLAGLLARGDKNAAVEAMGAGLTKLLLRIHGEGGLDAVLAIGGAQGSMIAAPALQSLPVGVPKMLLSVIANGQAMFGPFVGTCDVMVMHSVADILGLNRITRKVLAEAAGAVVGMAETAVPDGEADRPTIALTMAGVTTPCAMRLRAALEARGYEVVAFHCNGIGAKAMEDMAAAGQVQGIIDLSPHDIGGLLFGGLMRAYPDRLRSQAQAGVPVVFVPGSADFILLGPYDQMPAEMQQRKLVRHNPIHTHVRANRAEMRAVGAFVGERLGESRGPVAVMLPLKGFSQLNIEGGPLFDPQADAGFAEGLGQALPAQTQAPFEIVEVPHHVNDPAFADAVAARIASMVPIQGAPQGGCDD